MARHFYGQKVFYNVALFLRQNESFGHRQERTRPSVGHMQGSRPPDPGQSGSRRHPALLLPLRRWGTARPPCSERQPDHDCGAKHVWAAADSTVSNTGEANTHRQNCRNACFSSFVLSSWATGSILGGVSNGVPWKDTSLNKSKHYNMYKFIYTKNTQIHLMYYNNYIFEF